MTLLIIKNSFNYAKTKEFISKYVNGIDAIKVWENYVNKIATIMLSLKIPNN